MQMRLTVTVTRVLTSTLVVVTSAAATSVASAAPLAPSAGCLTVHVGPQVSGGAAASYFKLSVAPGARAHEAVLLANPEPYVCDVGLDATYGRTAVNSGDTYPFVPSGRCVRTSCWLSQLPARVAVPARGRLVVPFEIDVPAGTGPGDYLAGVLVRPELSSAAPRASKTGVGAVVTTSVGIGVAVEVPGKLVPRVSIPSVTLDLSSGTPLLHILERNSGNTWEHPSGGAIVSGGASTPLRLGIDSDTLLPGDVATLTLPVEGVKRGSHPTEVELWYDHDRKRAIWRGTLIYPYTVPAPGSRATTPVVVTTSHTPGWIIALAAGLAGLVVVLVAVVLILVARRRRRDANEPEPALSPAAPLAAVASNGSGPGRTPPDEPA
jgi:hypothetical protein